MPKPLSLDVLEESQLLGPLAGITSIIGWGIGGGTSTCIIGFIGVIGAGTPVCIIGFIGGVIGVGATICIMAIGAIGGVIGVVTPM